jgi:PleD family two-component response regulator
MTAASNINRFDAPEPRRTAIHEIVIVDSACELYGDFVRAAEDGEVGLHFCIDGRSAVRLARRFRADAWIVATDLPDMSGFDLLTMLVPHVLQGDVNQSLGGSRISPEQIGQAMRSGIFIVSDTYRLEDEQRSLAEGVAGYLVRPVTLDLIRLARQPLGQQRNESVIVVDAERNV